MAFPISMAHRKSTLAVAALAALSLALVSCSAAEESGNESTQEAVVSSPVILNDGTLRVCTTDVPPNNFYDENNEHQGVEIDIASALAEQLGLDLVLETYSFKGLIPALQAEQCDLIMGSLFIKPEREEVVNFVPYLYSGQTVAVNSENPKDITGFDDSLCGTSVAAVNGGSGITALEERAKECEAAGQDTVNITPVDSGTDGLQQLIAGQTEAFVNTTEQISFYQQESDEIEMVGEPFAQVEVGAATAKENEELHEALSAAFDDLASDGSYLEILEEWGVEANDVTK